MFKKKQSQHEQHLEFLQKETLRLQTRERNVIKSIMKVSDQINKLKRKEEELVIKLRSFNRELSTVRLALSDNKKRNLDLAKKISSNEFVGHRKPGPSNEYLTQKKSEAFYEDREGPNGEVWFRVNPSSAGPSKKYS